MFQSKEKFLKSLTVIVCVYALAFLMQSCATPVKVYNVDECLRHYMFPEASAGIVRILDRGPDFYMVMNSKGTKYKFSPEYVIGNYVQVSCEKVGL